MKAARSYPIVQVMNATKLPIYNALMIALQMLLDPGGGMYLLILFIEYEFMKMFI